MRAEIVNTADLRWPHKTAGSVRIERQTWGAFWVLVISLKSTSIVYLQKEGIVLYTIQQDTSQPPYNAGTPGKKNPKNL